MTTDLRGSDVVRTVAAVGSSLVLAAILGTVGWLVVRPVPDNGGPVAAGVSAYPAGAGRGTAAGSPTATPTLPVRPRSTPANRASVRPTPPHRLPAWQLPPAPPVWSASPGTTTCPHHAGKDATKEQVKEALVLAAAREYWQTAAAPMDLVGPLPSITVPVDLIAAVAWRESGWQSTIVACDHGLGTMHLMPTTATWLNRRFATSYDITTLAGNTALGAEYLEWLTLYFGLYYFGSYDLDAAAAVGRGGMRLTLLDVVVSAYSVGPRALERDNATPGFFGDDWLAIPNRSYVDSVRALMSFCVCTAY